MSARPPSRPAESDARGLRRVLGLPDLVLGQILVVVGTNWFGTAALLGARHVLVWALGLLLFHLPLAAVVVHLTRARPEEGGVYQWARAEFGETAGFLAGFNMWLFIAAFTSTLGLATSQGIAYGAGAVGRELALPPALLHAALIALLVVLAISGLAASRVLHDAGAVLLLGLLVALAAFAAAFGHRPLDAPQVAGASPLRSVELFAKAAVFGLAGLECLSTLAGETRRPERDLPRSVLLAAPCIGLVYALGTEAVRRLSPDGTIDLVNPVAQAYARAGGSVAAAVAIGALLVRDVAQASLSFTALTRLPMVAGWDRLVPAWFSRLDPRRGTPVGSILVAGALALGLGIVGSLGVAAGEAYQVLQSAAGLFFGATYLLLFAIPLAGRGRKAMPGWLKAAAASGLAVTVLFMALGVVPIVEVASDARFGAKVLGVFVAGEALAFALLARGRRAARQADVRPSRP